MILTDVNVLVYAYREDAPQHHLFRAWFGEVVARDEAFAYADIILSGFLRVVTHPRVFPSPAPIGDALGFTEALRAQPNAVLVSPGPRHWAIFSALCQESRAKGNIVADAYLAALAIESGCEWVTSDRDFARFPGLRWRYPLQPQ